MKVFWIVLGILIAVQGICVLSGIIELDRFSTGIYVTALGIDTVRRGLLEDK